MQNLNLNTFPYYDDFEPSKGFHKILFKPGYAVQARELTQIQSILQNQIKTFGDNILVDGTVITGCAESTNFKMQYIKILDMFTSPSSVLIDNTAMADFEGKTLIGANQSVTAIIKKAAESTDAEPYKTFYLQYTATGLDNTTTTFAPNEQVTIVETNEVVAVADSPVDPVGIGSLFTVGEGIVYAKGNFVIHDSQTIIIDRYSPTPTEKVGFLITESVITADDDSTLLDPARGSFNYTAPGADRYNLETLLVSYGITDTIPDEFYILFEVADGLIRRKYNFTRYSELNKTLARRTYDESGDYTVRQFPLLVQEHLNNGTNNGRYTAGEGGDASQLAINVQPGKAYVRGFEHELFSTEYLAIDKGIDVNTKENETVSTNYGYYVTSSALYGYWPINSSSTVTMTGGSLTGTARIREVEYVSAGVYNIYLYDVRVTAGAFSTLTTLTSGSFTATVTAAIGGAAKPTTIFPSARTNLKTLADESFVYRRVYTGVSESGGNASITLAGSEAFVGSTTNDIIITKSGASYNPLTFTGATPSGANVNITGISGSPGTVDIMILCRKTVGPNVKTLVNDQYVVLESNASASPYLGYYDVHEIKEVWVANNAASYPADHAALVADTANWALTTDYTFDNGQRDGLYDIATITPGSTWGGTWVTKKVIILFSYFEHGTGSPYYTVDSYPLPAENVAAGATEIEWYELPVYVSSTGESFNLRDCVDFRPTINLSTNFPCIDITTASNVTRRNPSRLTTLVAGFAHPAPQEELIADVSYHLSRIDRIVVDAEGNFTTVTGVPSLTPVYPRQPDNAMTLGYVSVAPYPSLSPYMAKVVGMPQYACSVSAVDNRRYTMRDIGSIQRRIDRLEYYTSLSMLEQSTANMTISGAGGVDRFKNGILVDDFVGHNVGNVLDPAYKCSIGNSELHPFVIMDNIDLMYDSGTLVRKAPDTIIVVRQPLISATYEIDDLIDNGGGATGTLVHNVLLGSNTVYKWSRLYLNDVTGTFADGNTLTAGTGTITSVATGILQDDILPDTVVIPVDGNLATLPYSHQVYAQNQYASKTRNVVSQLLFTYAGTMNLTPTGDVWTDTSTLPEVQVNAGGTADNWTSMENAWGTEWGAWENVWQGVETTARDIESKDIDDISREVTTEITETTVQRQQRRGTGITPTTSTSTTSIGSRVVSTALLPYMRSIVVTFNASGLKPNTTVYPFFDGINVTDNCRMIGNVYGTPLLVSATGSITGEFLIPAGRFIAGSKLFVLCDTLSGPASTAINTIATASFSSSGLAVAEQGTILSTQAPQVTIDQQTQTQDLVISRQTSLTTRIEGLPAKNDPIAQTFIINNNPNGVLLTKADLYFRTKSSTASITLQIREVINGYPAAGVLPYSTVTLEPKDINISEDATSVTEFKFESPVYLKNDTEYCFVLLPIGDDEDYNLWVAELGSTVVGTTERIDKQPATGVLFVSANNNTWTAIQSEDIKFTLYNALFVPATPATLTFKNVPLDYMTVVNPTGTFSVGDTVSFWDASRVGGGVIKYYDPLRGIAQVAVTDGSALTAYMIYNDTAACQATTAYQIVNVDSLSPTIAHLDFNNTDVTWTYSIQGSTAASLSTTGTTYLTTPGVIDSVSNGGAGDLVIVATVETSDDNISPVIDVTRAGCVVISNYISSSNSNEGNAASGTARSRYITRRVILDDGYEAEDLRVYITADIPAAASIGVYAKLLNETDTTAFEDRPWTLLSTTSVTTPGAREYIYTIPAGAVNTAAGALDTGSDVYTYSTTAGVGAPGSDYVGFKTFAVKIVLLSTDTTQTPTIFDMRAIALMV
jgi:Domain of unknown function (DUF4815)